MGDKKRKELKPNLCFLWVWKVGQAPWPVGRVPRQNASLGTILEPAGITQGITARYYSRFGDWLGFWTGWGRPRKHLWHLDSTLDLDRSQAKCLSLHCLLGMLLFFGFLLGLLTLGTPIRGSEMRVMVWVELWSGFDFQSPPSSHRGVVSQTRSKSIWGVANIAAALPTDLYVAL